MGTGTGLYLPDTYFIALFASKIISPLEKLQSRDRYSLAFE